MIAPRGPVRRTSIGVSVMSSVSRFSGEWRGPAVGTATSRQSAPSAQYFEPGRGNAGTPPAQPAQPAMDRSLNERLTQLFNDESVERLSARLAEFRRSLEQTLEKSSQPYQLLMQLEETNLKDCARCTQQLQARLDTNPHYRVLGKLREAQQLLDQLEFPRR
jgi:hypothetical protein